MLTGRCLLVPLLVLHMRRREYAVVYGAGFPNQTGPLDLRLRDKSNKLHPRHAPELSCTRQMMNVIQSASGFPIEFATPTAATNE